MMTIGTPLLWSLLAAFVIAALLVDFFAISKQGAHKVSMRQAAVWSLVWVAVSFVFVGWLWWYLGGTEGKALAHTKALEFIAGYLVEKALAVDSIPAIFAITTDPFIVLTSNGSANLGLRAMYFLLAGMHERFHLLSCGLAIALVFIGARMLLADVCTIPVAWSLAFTVTVLALAMILSLRFARKATPGGAYPFRAKRAPEHEHAAPR